MNKLVIGAIVSFFMAAMFFIVSAINYVDYLADLHLDELRRIDPLMFGPITSTDYYFRNFVAYALGCVIAALIGFILLILNRHHEVVSSRT